MQLLKFFRLSLTFYKSFALASIAITGFCIFLIRKHGLGAFSTVFGFKIIGSIVIFYFIANYKKKEFYYYRNHGLSSNLLWIIAESIDLSLFFLGISLGLKWK